MIGLKNRISNLFIDREFFMRANGQVRFLKVSAKLQRIIAAISLVVVGALLLATLVMALNQYSVSLERMALVEKEAEIQSAEERVATYGKSIDDVAADLSKRQDLLDSLGERYFDNEELLLEDKDIKNNSDLPLSDKVGKLIPEAAGLAKIEERQIRFAQKITKVAQIRAKQAEQAIREFGLNPQQFTASSQARGGPFIPFFGNSSDNQSQLINDPRFAQLAEALEYMRTLENGLAAIPSAMPAATYTLSSAFGYRRDPINGGGAMHSGLDFKAAYGTPILAAADGIVTKAGWQGGYGKTIEVTHGNGLLTRYAHMSKLDAVVGQKVDRGVQIGRMGSTGRSTGTHLHFEVRHNGRAINPRKFLEANPNVLKIQADARNSASKEK